MNTCMITRKPMTVDIDEMFNRAFGRPFHTSRSQAGYMPRVNIRETEANATLTFELPGMEKGDIKVTVADGILTVAGERKVQASDEKAEFVRNEIRSGGFERSFTLPETIDTENISADYKNGLLIITLAKKEEAKPKEISVEVK